MKVLTDKTVTNCSMLKLKNLKIVESKAALCDIADGKVLLNTVNAHSFNVAQKDELFAEALVNGDYLIPDGASIIKACKLLKAKSQPKERIAGWDLFAFEMQKLNEKGEMKKEKLSVMFMGSSEKVLICDYRRMCPTRCDNKQVGSGSDCADSDKPTAKIYVVVRYKE